MEAEHAEQTIKEPASVTCSHCGRTAQFSSDQEIEQARWVLFQPRPPAHCSECQHSFTRLFKDGCAEHDIKDQVVPRTGQKI